MYELLDTVTLKDGESVELGVVRAPDADWAERLEALLGHKGELWQWQNSQVLRNDVGIDVFYYILHRDGEPFANIMTAEINGVGILGHVWTREEDRRKGAASRIMERQMRHFRERAGSALFLGTDFDSAAYHIYAGFGFESVEVAGSGHMHWFADGADAFEAAFFPSGTTVVEDLCWRHWPVAPVLMMGPYPGFIRCAPWRVFGRVSTEGCMLPVLREAADNMGPTATRILRHEATGAVVGIAARGWDPHEGGALLVDVYCHPGFWGEAPRLLAALELADGIRCVAYTDMETQDKRALLEGAGFTPAASVSDHVVDAAARNAGVTVQRWVSTGR